nr:MAG TPA: hypothetical protein [Caudoviricetes sp.]
MWVPPHPLAVSLYQNLFSTEPDNTVESFVRLAIEVEY